MKQQTIFIGLIFLLMVTFSCKSTSTSVITGENYDSKKDETTLILVPYGNITIPNKWNKKSYNEISKQHFFTNSDSTTLAIAKNPKQKYPFYQNEDSDKEFVINFVKWEADYFKEKGIIVTTLEDKSSQGYILFEAKTGEDKYDIFLIGSKNGFAYNFLSSSNVWTKEDIKMFENI